MKISGLTTGIIDLSSTPSIGGVAKLKKGDIVLFEGGEWNVEFPPKKAQRGVWYIGLQADSVKRYVKIVENQKPRMTPHEKKTLHRNIKSVCEQLSGNERKLVELVRSYYNNLATHNNYDERDVRDAMGKFPVEILKKSGIVL